MLGCAEQRRALADDIALRQEGVAQVMAGQVDAAGEVQLVQPAGGEGGHGQRLFA